MRAPHRDLVIGASLTLALGLLPVSGIPGQTGALSQHTHPNSAPPWSSAAAFQDEGVLKSIGFEDAFLDSVTMISSPRFIDSHRIVFSDTRECRLHIVDLQSEDVLRIGRRGSGPGEFQMPSNLAVLRGGQILVWDYRLMRLSHFDEAGELVEASRLELAVPTGADIEQLSEDRVGLLPGSTQLAGEHYDRLLLLGADLKPLSSFLAPCTGRVAALEEAYGMGQCNRILASGIGETVLIGESFTYSVRRYNLAGDLLWDSGQLDPEFTEPASRISSRGEGQSPLVLIHAHNGLSRLLEVPDRGFVVGGWFSQARQGAGTTTSPVGFLLMDRARLRRMVRRPLGSCQ